MVAISPHTTRATGTILTAVIYNGDHANHIVNAQALNNAKVEGPGVPVVDNRLVRFDGTSGTLIKDGGALVIGTTSIADDAVTNAKLDNMAQSTIKGRAAGAGTGDPTDLTATQATAILNNFTTGLKGLVPSSPGGTTAFLRADGNWATAVQSEDVNALIVSGVTPGASLDINLTTYTGYRSLLLVFENFIPATDDVELMLRTSTNGGSSYDSGASDYGWTCSGSVNGGFVGGANSNNSQIRIAGHNSASGSVSNVTAEGGYSGFMWILGRLQTACWTKIHANGGYWSAFGEPSTFQTTGWRKTTADVDAIRIIFETGNIASGVYQLYGVL